MNARIADWETLNRTYHDRIMQYFNGQREYDSQKIRDPQKRILYQSHHNCKMLVHALVKAKNYRQVEYETARCWLTSKEYPARLKPMLTRQSREMADDLEKLTKAAKETHRICWNLAEKIVKQNG
jgi:hypothetical protein